jgi:hypothetical protein
MTYQQRGPKTFVQSFDTLISTNCRHRMEDALVIPSGFLQKFR